MLAKPSQPHFRIEHSQYRWVFTTIFVICLNLALVVAPFGPRTVQAAGEINPECTHQIFLPTVIRGGTEAPTPAVQSDTEETFAAQVADGAADVVRGVFAQDVLALKVTQQPEDNAGYVSPEPGTVTQFSQAESYDVIGLLAHNTLSGQLFFKLSPGGIISIIYGDGSRKHYQVSAVAEFQALQPNSVTSNFVDLQTGETLSAGKLFTRMYTGGDHVTFQTCIAKDGSASWGRIFIIAEPVSA